MQQHSGLQLQPGRAMIAYLSDRHMASRPSVPQGTDKACALNGPKSVGMDSRAGGQYGRFVFGRWRPPCGWQRLFAALRGS